MPGKRKPSASKSDILYCRKFPPELKQRCEGIAGFLGQTITEFVAAILEEETKELKEAHQTVRRWHEARQKTAKLGLHEGR